MPIVSVAPLTPAPPSPAEARNGADILLDTLIESGVDTVFGYPGGAALPLYDALYHRPALRHVLVRHEQAAVHAAEGYARSTGRVGVVLVTSGPGVGNTITGLLDAMSDSVPLLCISGQVATAVIGTEAFQESDALGMSRPVTKWNHQPRRADDVAPAVARALAIAGSGRPGPVLLDVPKDVQLARAGARPSARPSRALRSARESLDGAQLRAAVGRSLRAHGGARQSLAARPARRPLRAHQHGPARRGDARAGPARRWRESRPARKPATSRRSIRSAASPER